MDNVSREKYDALMGRFVEYRDTKQWDLAKASIEQLLGLEHSVNLTDEEKRTLYLRASQVYFELELYDQTIDFCNKAILLFPDYPNCYCNKYLAISAEITNRLNNNQDVDSQVESARINCSTWIEKSKKANDKDNLAKALTALGYSLSHNEPTDYEKALSLAEEALTYDPNHEYAKELMRFLSKPIEININSMKAAFDGYDEKPCVLADEINESVEKLMTLLKMRGEDATATLKKMEYRFTEDDGLKYTHKYSLNIGSSGVWTICDDCELFHKPTCQYGTPEHSIEEICKYPQIPNKLLVEFDFEGSAMRGREYNYNRIGYIILSANYGVHHLEGVTLKRLYMSKGRGLLEAIKKAITEQEHIIAEERKHQEEERQKAKYRSQNRCQHCGGVFQGVYTKRCASCGKEKDYSMRSTNTQKKVSGGKGNEKRKSGKIFGVIAVVLAIVLMVVVVNKISNDYADDYTYDVSSYETYAEYGYHTMYFDLNGGDGEISPIEVANGDYFDLPTLIPERDGYSFEGWYVQRTVDQKWYCKDTFSWMEWDGDASYGNTPCLYEPGLNLQFDDSWKKDGGEESNYIFYAVWY